MTAISPEQTIHAAHEAFNRGDIQAMLAFYGDDATVLAEPARELHGRQAAGELLGEYHRMGIRTRIDETRAIISGDTALCYTRWTLTTADGRSSHGTATVVLRRMDDRWLIAIDNAFGERVFTLSQPLFDKSVIIPPDAGEHLHVLGIDVTVKVPSQETGGNLAVFFTTDPPGGGPPPHRHRREEEILVVLQGEYEFFINGETHRGGPGTMAMLRRDDVHTFRRLSETEGRILAFVMPGDFEGFFRGIDALGPNPPIADVLTVGANHGLEFVLPQQ